MHKQAYSTWSFSATKIRSSPGSMPNAQYPPYLFPPTETSAEAGGGCGTGLLDGALALRLVDAPPPPDPLAAPVADAEEEPLGAGAFDGTPVPSPPLLMPPPPLALALLLWLPPAPFALPVLTIPAVLANNCSLRATLTPPSPQSRCATTTAERREISSRMETFVFCRRSFSAARYSTLACSWLSQAFLRWRHFKAAGFGGTVDLVVLVGG